MRVLVADSNVLLSDVYAKYLSECGFQVFTADDGLECIAKLLEVHPDVLVLDLDLLWGGGDGVLDRIRSDAEFPQPAVIVLASPHVPSQIHRIAEFPIHELCFKPLRPQGLFRSIHKLHCNMHHWLNRETQTDEGLQEKDAVLAS